VRGKCQCYLLSKRASLSPTYGITRVEYASHIALVLGTDLVLTKDTPILTCTHVKVSLLQSGVSHDVCDPRPY
jgi:hypothetical protein